jgi:hypothetical protein
MDDVMETLELMMYVEGDKIKNGRKIFKKETGQMFKLSEWRDALEVSSKGTGRMLFFKM